MWSFFSRDPAKDFPYEIGEPIPGLDDKSIWTLHRAKKKGSTGGEDVSVFVFECKNGNEHLLDVARSAVKRLKTLRHPSILAYLDSLETDKVIYLATERVESLYSRLTRKADSDEDPKKQLYLSWGIFQITRALNFLNNDGNLRHNNVNLWSVFVNEESGEWKLGGVEYMTAVDAVYTPLPPTFQVYYPADVKENVKPATKCSVDVWGLGCLIWETYNGPLNSSSQLKITDKIPKQLQVIYRESISGNAEGRPNPADVIARCRSNGGYFKNELVDALLFLEEIQMKERGENARFFSQLAGRLESFPDGVGRYKILPQLLAAFEFVDAGSAVLPPLLQLGCQLPDAEYQRKVVPCVVKLFASNDRATRLRLLQQLDRFVDHLQTATVNEAIFPQVAKGFLDTNAAVREQTIKSVVHLAPKLDYNNLNVETLRYFAKLQLKDEHGGIRTNTTVCLGKIAQHLHPQIRQKVLIGAFIRGTRDPFPPARAASILALAATQQYFLLQEVANRILPALCPLTTDVDKGVRDNAFRTIRGFLSKLERVSEDPGLRESMEADVNTATPSLSNAAATWAGWAVTAVTAKFYRSQSDTPKPSNPHSASRILLNKPASLGCLASGWLPRLLSALRQRFANVPVCIFRAKSSQETYTTLHNADKRRSNHPEAKQPNSNRTSLNSNEQASSSQSSASTTATTSSATSVTSLDHDHEHDLQNATNRESDCDWDWDADNWGDMEQQPSAISGHGTSNVSPSPHSPKPSDQWTSLEEEPEEEAAQTGEDKNECSEVGWEDTEFQPLEDFQPLEQSGNAESTGGSVSGNNKLEEARRKREERKLARQRQMEAKRAVKLRNNVTARKL